MRSVLPSFALILFATGVTAQHQLTRDDTLRGSITAQRSWWDLRYYKLDVSIHPDDQSIHGVVEVNYSVVQAGQILQIDRQPPLRISQVYQDGEPVKYKKIGTNASSDFLPFLRALLVFGLSPIDLLRLSQKNITCTFCYFAGVTTMLR